MCNFSTKCNRTMLIMSENMLGNMSEKMSEKAPEVEASKQWCFKNRFKWIFLFWISINLFKNWHHWKAEINTLLMGYGISMEVFLLLYLYWRKRYESPIGSKVNTFKKSRLQRSIKLYLQFIIFFFSGSRPFPRFLGVVTLFLGLIYWEKKNFISPRTMQAAMKGTEG